MDAASTAERSLTNSRVWAIVAVLCLANVLSYADRMLMAALGSALKAEFALSDTQLGMLTGLSFVLFYVFMSLPFGWLTDRVSRRGLITVCLGLWSAVTLSTGFARSYAQIFLLRMAVGVGEAGCLPAGQSLISDLFPPSKRFLSNGLFTATSMLGVMIAFSVGGALGQSHGWRIAFMAFGAPGILVALAAWLVIREPQRGRFDGGAPAIPDAAGRTALKLARNPAYVLLVLAAAVNGAAIGGAPLWLPQFFIRSHGMTMAQIGLLFGLVSGLAMFAGQVVGAVVSDRLARRGLAQPVYLSALCALIAAPISVAVLWTGSTTVALGCVFVSGFLTSAVVPGVSAAVMNVVEPASRGLASAIQMSVVILLGAGLAPVLIGKASDLARPHFGEESLRIALVGLQLLPLATTVLCVLAARATAKRLA